MLHCYVALESGQTFLKNKYRAHRRQWNLVLIVKVIDTFKPEYLRSKSLMIDFCPAEYRMCTIAQFQTKLSCRKLFVLVVCGELQLSVLKHVKYFSPSY